MLADQCAGDRAVVDFSDSDDEVRGPLNAVYAVTLSAVVYAFRLLLPEDAPTNHGLYAPLEVIAPEGCVLNARPPRAVAAGNVETSQRIVDVVLGALAQALPAQDSRRRAPARCRNLLFGDDRVRLLRDHRRRRGRRRRRRRRQRASRRT